MIEHTTAVAALGDPRTPPIALADIAQVYPDLWLAVVAHPQAYPGLLDWLALRGDPAVAAAVQARRATPFPSHVGPTAGAYPVALPGAGPLPVVERSSVRRAFDSITGFEGEAIVHFRDLFRDTFKRHTREDLDVLLCSGTQAARNDRQWRLPWLYARVFAVLFSAFLLLWVCMLVFRDNSGNVVPGVIFTGALVMPATVMVFFWEFNQARNVSLFDVIRFFFIGGAMSILLTFVVSAVTDLFHSSGSYGVGAAFVEAGFIGFTEELAKAVVVFVLLRGLYGCLISNGLLVGAVVGTGFAVFETMGYGTSAWIDDVVNDTLTLEYTLFVRGILSVGGHVVWAAISGAAIMASQRPGASRIDHRTMDWGRCIALFCVPFLLHTMWDFVSFVVRAEIPAYTLMVLLIVAAWVFIVRLINSGLRQYAALLRQGV